MGETVIRVDLEELLTSGRPVVIELGCGDKAQPYAVDGRLGIDRIALSHVDIVTNLEEGLSFLPDRSVDGIRARSLFEHISKFEYLLQEIVRVLKDDGLCRLMVPHFSNPYFYSDPTHVRFFGLYTFFYYCRPELQLRRKVPVFYSDIRIRITSLRLRFRSPFKGRKWWKKGQEKLFNLNSGMQEFYEENLCQLLPCYGISIEFKPDRSPVIGVGTGLKR